MVWFVIMVVKKKKKRARKPMENFRELMQLVFDEMGDVEA